MKYQVHTFGCKVNTYDTGLIQKNLLLKNISDSQTTAGVHILNTCAVTAEATKEAVKLIRKLKARDPFCTVVVTGCAAQVDTDSFKDLPGVDLVVANSHKGMLPQILDQYSRGVRGEKIFKSNIFRKEDLEMGGGVEKSHTRSFLKIQDGCNSFCTYCVIPFARGKSRSLPIRQLVQRINEIHAAGMQEVVLTGVHIGDYEDEVLGKKKSLEDLIESVLTQTKIPRIRLSSIEPTELSERLLEMYSDRRLCPHFHMSIQSANTDVLSKMKRNYGQADVISSLEKIVSRVPGAFIGMDLIAGFPTETTEQFENSYEVLTQTPWTRIHVFPYSERNGTKAASLSESVPQSQKMNRAQKLRELSLHRYQSEALKQIESKKEVLVLKKIGQKTNRRPNGLSRDYWPVEIQGFDNPDEPENLEKFVGREIEIQIKEYVHNPQKMEGHFLGRRFNTSGVNISGANQ